LLIHLPIINAISICQFRMCIPLREYKEESNIVIVVVFDCNFSATKRVFDGHPEIIGNGELKVKQCRKWPLEVTSFYIHGSIVG